MQCRLRDRRSRLFSLGLRPCPLRTEIPPDSLTLLIILCTVEGEISKSLPIFLWGTLILNISIIFSRICWQTGDPRPIFAPKGLDLSWMLLLYQIIITITCWHQLFQNTSLFNQFTSLLALNCSCPNFFWNVLQVWMTGKDVYLQMTWSWPDKTWNIFCSYCLQWNTSQSKFRNHYFLFLFAFSILSQLFLIWGCTRANRLSQQHDAIDHETRKSQWHSGGIFLNLRTETVAHRDGDCVYSSHKSIVLPRKTWNINTFWINYDGSCVCLLYLLFYWQMVGLGAGVGLRAHKCVMQYK